MVFLSSAATLLGIGLLLSGPAQASEGDEVEVEKPPPAWRVGGCFGADPSCVLLNLKAEVAGERLGFSLSGLVAPGPDIYAGSALKLYGPMGSKFGRPARLYGYGGVGLMAMDEEPEVIMGLGVGQDRHFGPDDRALFQLYGGLSYSTKGYVTPTVGVASLWSL